MLIEAVLNLAFAPITLLLSLIPEIEFTWEGTLTTYAGQIGGMLGGLNQIIPISELATVIGWVLGTVVPFGLTFSLVVWVYSHLPIVGSGS